MNKNADKLPSIEYDRGTLLVSGLSLAMADSIRDLVKWDKRIDAWRAPAHLYVPLLTRIRSLGANHIDHVRQSQVPERAWEPVALRPYQEAALLAWKAAGGRGLVGLPTGAGKTRVALAAAQRSKRSTLCLVPTRVLLHQWLATIREIYPGELGVLGDGQHIIRPITVATFESAFRKGWSFANRFDLLIVDEVHHFGDGERDEALEVCPAPFRLGLSASMDNSRKDRLKQLIGWTVFEQRPSDLVGSALSEFEVCCLHLPLTYNEKLVYQRDYNVFRQFFDAFKASQPKGSWKDFVRVAGKSRSGRAAIVAHRRAKRTLSLTEGKLSMLCQLLNRHNQQRKLIFTADSVTALAIARKLFIAPITGEIGKRERDTLLAALRAGTIKTIVSCKVLNEGFDIPEAEVAIIVGGSGSGREHIQRIGRVLRPVKGKKAQIYELIAADTPEVKQSRRRGHDLEERRYERFPI
jgi:superfamily II DNA or RNA helicase